MHMTQQPRGPCNPPRASVLMLLCVAGSGVDSAYFFHVFFKGVTTGSRGEEAKECVRVWLRPQRDPSEEVGRNSDWLCFIFGETKIKTQTGHQQKITAGRAHTRPHRLVSS